MAEQADLSSNIYYQRSPQNFLMLSDIINKHPKTYGGLLKGKQCTLLMAWIDEQLPLLKDDVYKASTKCYWILNGLTDFPLCQTCGLKDGYIGKNVKLAQGYHPYCCMSCAQLSPTVNQRKKDGCMRSLGVEHPLQSAVCMQKFHQTCLENFGVDHNFKSSGCIEKRKQTWAENYGCAHPMQSSICQSNYCHSFCRNMALKTQANATMCK